MRRVLVAALLTVLPVLPATLPAAAEDLPPEAPLEITVTDLLPRAPEPGDAFEVVGTVRNAGTVAVEEVSVRLRVGDRVANRGDLREADTDRPLTRSLSSTTTRVQLDGPLAPGQRVRFDIRTTVEALGLGKLGVYPLDVEARGDAGNGPGERLGFVPTWVPWFAGDPVARTRVAVVWPLVDQPRQLADGSFADDELVGALGKGGRLGRLLAAARAGERSECGGAARRPDGSVTPAPTRCEPVPVTYAVDPDLVAAAAAFADEHRVDGDKRSGVPEAQAWLTSLSDAGRAASVLALPYADPDVTALADQPGGGFREDAARASALGAAEVRDTLRLAPLTSVAWPPSGPITTPGLQLLAQTGARAFVLDPSAFGQPENEPDETPGTQTLLPTAATDGTDATGLVVEPDLSSLLSGQLATELGPRLAEQRFLAETAIVAAQRPSRQRTLVLALDRRGDVVVGAAGNALRDLGRVPWLCPVSLAEAAVGTEHCADEEPRTDPMERADRGPLAVRSGALPDDVLTGVGRDRDVATQLTDAVLSDQPADQAAVSRIALGLRRSIARAESSAWRTEPATGRAFAGSLHRHVTDLADRVSVYGGQVLLTSTSGRLQVSLENRLDVPIRVRVHFEDTAQALQPIETDLIDVSPGNAVPAVVRAQTRKSGQYVVRAVVYDREGRAFPMPVGEVTPRYADVVVRSTGYGRVALAVTLGGAGVLFLAAGVRIVRRARAARA